MARASCAVVKPRAALPEAQMHVYAAGHGFNCDARQDFDKAASALAWQRTLDFLDKNMK